MVAEAVLMVVDPGLVAVVVLEYLVLVQAVQVVPAYLLVAVEVVVAMAAPVVLVVQ